MKVQPLEEKQHLLDNVTRQILAMPERRLNIAYTTPPYFKLADTK